MRVIRDGNNPDASTFTKFLLDAGENNINLERILNTNTIRIPDNLLKPSHIPNTPDTLITQIFPSIKYDAPHCSRTSASISSSSFIAFGRNR